MWYDTELGARYWYGSTQAIANSWEIYNYYRGLSQPWSIESIAALCGNFQYEGIMNPYIRETTQSGAFGLAQWITHKQTMINWANSRGLRPTSGPAQVQYIESERIGGVDDQYLAREPYRDIKFNDFAYNTKSLTAQELAHVWWNNYERSAEYQAVRGTAAANYYSQFTGEPPGPVPGDFDKWLLFLFKGGRKRVKRTIYI